MGAVLSGTLLLKPDRVAQELDVSRSTVYALLRDGELPAIRIGGRFRVRRDHLEAWVKQHPIVGEQRYPRRA